MKMIEILTTPKAPLKPAQARLNALKKNQDIAKQALAREKQQQQLAKAQDRVKQLNANKIRQLARTSGMCRHLFREELVD